jgi:uncharacterized protein
MTTALLQWERDCERWLRGRTPADPAHDLSHIKRVVNNARHLTDIESANVLVTIPAAWLHDCVQVAKDSPERSRVSGLAATEACRFMAGLGYPAELMDALHHAVEAHSYSANIELRSLEAAIVQDADRLDALGAIGTARCILTGGAMGSGIYHPDDPLCEQRAPDDKAWMVDHFYSKLFKLPATMQTAAGKAEAERRVSFMQQFLAELKREVL